MEVQENMKVTQIATLNIKEIHEVRVSEGPNKNFTVDFFFCFFVFAIIIIFIITIIVIKELEILEKKSHNNVV